MSLTTCRECGSALPSHLQFCPNCGVRIDGTPFDSSSVQAEPVPPVPPTGPVQPPAAVSTVQQPAPTQPSPVQTYEPSAVPPRRTEMRRFVLTAVVACLLAFAGRMVYTAVTSEPEQPGELVAQLPVGPEGGAVQFEGGGKLDVPKGALKQRETITVRRSLMRERIRAVDPSGGPPIVVPPGTLFIYILGPVDIELLLPVTLTLPAPPAPAQGLVFVSAASRVTFVPGNQRGRTITVTLTSFDFGRGPSVFVNRRDSDD